MAAPKGNQFWKLRSKHGRDKLFATAELLWDAACEYFEWCDKSDWKIATSTKAGVVDIPHKRPYSLTGLCLYLGCNTAYFRGFKKDCTDDFSTVITRIEETIETQQFDGAAIGAFNANIIARRLGLADINNVNLKDGRIFEGRIDFEQMAKILTNTVERQ